MCLLGFGKLFLYAAKRNSTLKSRSELKNIYFLSMKNSFRFHKLTSVTYSRKSLIFVYQEILIDKSGGVRNQCPTLACFDGQRRGAPRGCDFCLPKRNKVFCHTCIRYMIASYIHGGERKSTWSQHTPFSINLFSGSIIIFETLSQSIGCTRSRRGLGTKNEARRFVVVLLVSAVCPFPIILTAAYNQHAE